MTVRKFVKSKQLYRAEISKIEGYGEIFLELEDLLKEYCKIKCAEQRQLCADNADADYNFVGNRDEDSHIEVYVLKGSILYCPEPEM